MKKTFKIFAKLFSILGVLFVIYITNLDSKLVEVIYDYLQKYHEEKETKDTI